MTYYIARTKDDNTLLSIYPFEDRPYITVDELPEGDGPLMCTVDGILYRGSVYKKPSDPIEDLDAMVVDHEYRLALLELGLNESEV